MPAEIEIYILLLFQKPVNVTVNQLYFAVKTWSDNHIERLPIIEGTWARDARFLRYFSDVEGDQKICMYTELTT